MKFPKKYKKRFKRDTNNRPKGIIKKRSGRTIKKNKRSCIKIK